MLPKYVLMFRNSDKEVVVLGDYSNGFAVSPAVGKIQILSIII